MVEERKRGRRRREKNGQIKSGCVTSAASAFSNKNPLVFISSLRFSVVLCDSAVKPHPRERSGVSVRFVNFRRKSLVSNTFLLQDGDTVCGWPAQDVLAYGKGNPSREPRLLAQTGHHHEWVFCKKRATDENLKICLYAISTCGGFRRR